MDGSRPEADSTSCIRRFFGKRKMTCSVNPCILVVVLKGASRGGSSQARPRAGTGLVPGSAGLRAPVKAGFRISWISGTGLSWFSGLHPHSSRQERRESAADRTPHRSSTTQKHYGDPADRGGAGEQPVVARAVPGGVGLFVGVTRARRRGVGRRRLLWVGVHERHHHLAAGGECI
jgi:hypothetical protein